MGAKGREGTQTAAATLAAQLHGGQVDKSGRPYIGHLIRVVAHLRRLFPDAGSSELEAAWLHDALEDTAATKASLLSAGVSAAAVAIIQEVGSPIWPGPARCQR
jgi:(p)ppGpp synthase/HD superfamily hydrolase